MVANGSQNTINKITCGKLQMQSQDTAKSGPRTPTALFWSQVWGLDLESRRSAAALRRGYLYLEQRLSLLLSHIYMLLRMSRQVTNLVSVNTAPDRAAKVIGAVIENVKDKYTIVHAGNTTSRC